MAMRILETIRRAYGRFNQLTGVLGADPSEAAALREANRQLRNRLAALERERRLNDILVKHVPADLFIHEEHGPFVCWNPWVERSTGYSAEELSRMRAHDFLDGVDREMLGDYIAWCFERGRMSGRLRRLNKDGSVTPQDYASVGVEVDGERYVVGVGVDVSDIAAEERSYQEIFHATSDAIFIHDPEDARILDVNQPMVEMFGYESREEVCRLTVGDITSRSVPLAQEEAERLVQKAFEEEPQRFEWLGRKKNGAEFWIEVSLRSAEIDGQHRVLAAVRDIDERRRAEQALRASEERYRTLVQNMPVVCFAFDADGRFLSWNHACEQVYGYTAGEAVGASAYDLIVTPATLEATRDLIRRVFDGEVILGSEWQDRDKAGEIGWRYGNSFPILDVDGKVAFGVNLNIDITGRKRVEEALQESEAKFRSLVESTSDWIWEVDTEGVYTYVSPQVASFLGYTPDEVVGRRVFDLMPPDEAERVEKVFEEHVATGAPFVAFENINRHRDGGVVVLETSAVAVHDADGKVTGYRGVDRDITKRKHAEDALAETRGLLEAAIAQSPSGILIADAPNVSIRVGNAAAFGIRGGDRELLTGIEVEQHAWSWQTYRPDGSPYPPEELPLSRAVLKGESTALEEVIIRDVDGNDHWVSVNAAPVRDKAGAVTAGIVVFHDITERKRAEEAIQESEERYRSLYETASDAIFLMKGERFIDCNPATLRIFGRSREEFIDNTPYDLSPYMQPDGQRSQDKAFEKINAALGGEPQSFEWQHRRGDGEIFEAEVSLNRIQIQDEWYLLAVVRDVSERKRAQERLARYAERLEILHEIDQGILTAGSAEDIARAALGHVRRLLGCRRADIVLFDAAADQAVVLATDADHETRFQPGLSVPVAVFQHVLDAALCNEVSRLAFDPERSKRDRAFIAEGNRELVVTPMLYEGEVIGSLNVSFAEPESFSVEHEEIARQVAAQVAVAIQQARLREAVREHAEGLERRVAHRTQELSTLYDVSAVANEELDLETIMSRVLERVMEAVPSDAAAIHLLREDDKLELVVHHSLWDEVAKQVHYRQRGEGAVGQVLERGEPIVIADTHEDPRVAAVLPEAVTRYVGVPMRARGRQVGVLSLVRKSAAPPFSDGEVRMLSTVADQVGTVAESVRLRQLARQAAVLEERNRLARDLHDSVTQSLYSLTLLAEAGRMAAANGDPGDAAQQMERLAQVGQQALKEMRLMIHELRPPGLEEEGLAGALQKRLDAVEGRAGVEARLLVQGEAPLPLKAEEALYRIALEALNNALKHAGAKTVMVRLRTGNGHEAAVAELEVVDDGRGFEPGKVRPGGLGLTTMRERAEKLGGQLEIRSGEGTGTTVRVTLDQIKEQT
jgi:PAS domain S-box-containing protein